MSKELFNKIVNEVLAEEARAEALEILTIGSTHTGKWNKYIKDVTTYYAIGLNEDDDSAFNIICMALDMAKHYLVKAGLMQQNTDDSFGGYVKDFLEDDPEEN